MQEMSILEYLRAKSQIAKELDKNSPVTLEELLSEYCGVETIPHIVELLEKLPKFETDKLKISNCLLDGTFPYDSLVGLTSDDLKTLYGIADYLCLPTQLCEKLQSVLDKGTTGWTDLYGPLEFIKNGDIRGLKHICDTLEKFHIDYKNQGHYGFVYPAMSVAALHGQLDMLKWLHENGYHGYLNACESAAEGGHLECLKFLYENCKEHYEWHDCTFRKAAANGHVECLKFAHSCGHKFHMYVFTDAAKHGRFECMQFLHAIGVSMDAHVFSCAASYGNLEYIKWLHKIGCPSNSSACSAAAEKGHLNCLIWLHENGFSWDIQTTLSAAHFEHLECLKYAHTHGCPWHPEICLYAAGRDSLECLQYAIENGCPIPSSMYERMDIRKPSSCLKFLYEKGYRCRGMDIIQKTLGLV